MIDKIVTVFFSNPTNIGAIINRAIRLKVSIDIRTLLEMCNISNVTLYRFNHYFFLQFVHREFSARVG